MVSWGEILIALLNELYVDAVVFFVVDLQCVQFDGACALSGTYVV